MLSRRSSSLRGLPGRTSLVAAPTLLCSLALLAGWAATVQAQSCNTTLTGVVYSPNGVDPLPNILVYVPTTAVQPLPSGVSSCQAASQLVSGNPLVTTTTAADGTFALTSPGLAGTNVPLVIQAGKWRRQVVVPSIAACSTTSFSTRMPQNHSEGDIPQIAVVTGNADAGECVLRKMGLSDSEFTDPGGSGRINFFIGNGARIDTATPSESALMQVPATLNSYDMVMFPCQGNANDPNAIAAYQQNLINYADVGGRVFATHYSYVWLDNDPPFSGTANWYPRTQNSTTISSSPINATIDTTYPEGQVLAQWLQNIGATTTYGQLPLSVTRKDLNGVIAPTQSWATLNDAAQGNPVMQFTFDTPIGAAANPTIGLAFVNSPVVFRPGDASDSITINVTDTNPNAAADNSLNLKLTLPAGLTALSLAGSNANTGWICSVSALVCNRTVALAGGASDPLNLTVAVSAGAPLGNATLVTTLAGGGLSGNSQCGRVLFNEYHVEPSNGSGTFPVECDAQPESPQEKFLEFSLYNLSNFVSPVGNDPLDIQTLTTLNFPTPASIPYGTPLSATQLDATASAPGTITYSPSAGTVLPTGPQTVTATFTPTDPASYSSATATTTVTVTQDTTQTTLASNLNPSTIGQAVTFTATVIGSNAAPTGTVTFYDNGTAIGTGTLAAATGDQSTATLTTSTLTVGQHPITASYAATTNFAASSSTTLNQVVTLKPSSVAITGLVSPIYYGQIIGDTGVIQITGSATGGFTTVYIDNMLVCTLPVVPGVTEVCPANVGAGYPAGTHMVYVAFSGDTQYAPSQSPVYTVVIQPDVTTTTLGSTVNPALTNQPVTFTATVTAPYAQPTGSVTFSYNGTVLATVAVTPQGALAATASYTTSSLPAGTDDIVASYPASQYFQASSSTLAQVINVPNPRFTLNVMPNPLTILVHSSGTAAVSVTDLDGFSQAVALTCSGLPRETTCTFSPSTITAGGPAATLTIAPAAPHSCAAGPAELPPFSSPAAPLTWLALLALVGIFARRRRRLLAGLLLMGVLFLMPAVQGCGNCTDLGLLPGTYTVTVTGTSTGSPVRSASQTVTFNLTY